MQKTKKNMQIKEMVLLAVLTAIIIFMTLTGLAYIPINPVLKLTLLTIPVAVGAVLLGIKGGIFLGAVFGLTSFFTCFSIDALGVILLSINPVTTFITCVVPRILCGLIPALLYKWIKPKQVAVPVACVATALINTLLFLSFLWIFFANDFLTNTELVQLMGGTTINSFTALFMAFAGLNAVLEAVSSLVIGSAVCAAGLKVWNRND